MNRKCCSECPWNHENEHSIKFRNYSEKMKTIGIKEHKCHMIDKDVWGYDSEITDKNVCIGCRNNSK